MPVKDAADCISGTTPLRKFVDFIMSLCIEGGLFQAQTDEKKFLKLYQKGKIVYIFLDLSQVEPLSMGATIAIGIFKFAKSFGLEGNASISTDMTIKSLVDKVIRF